MANNTTIIGSSALQLDEFAQHLNSLDYSECTRVLYMDGLKDYHRHGFNEVSIQDEYKYRDMLIAEGKKGKTVNARIHALNSYNRWLGLPIIKEIKVNEEDEYLTTGIDGRYCSEYIIDYFENDF